MGLFEMFKKKNSGNVAKDRLKLLLVSDRANCSPDVMEKIKNGELGEIISVEAQMNCTHPATTRQWLENLPGGMMFYLGCHLIDLILRIQGKPKKIMPLNKCSGLEGVTAKDFPHLPVEGPEQAPRSLPARMLGILQLQKEAILS